MYTVYGVRLIGTREVRYVGQTTRPLRERISGHKSTALRAADRVYRLYSWIRSHGWDSIEFVVLEECPEDLVYLNYAERYWIASFRERGIELLNHTDGGDGVPGLPAWNRGIPMSPERIEQLRSIHLGSTHTPEHVERIRAGVIKHFQENGQKPVHEYWAEKYGEDEAKRLRAEASRKRSESLSGAGNPMYGRTGESAPAYGRVGAKHPMFGKAHSPEAKAKISAASRGKPKSEATRIRMSLANHRRHHSEKSSGQCRWCMGDSLDQVLREEGLLTDGDVG